MNTTEFEQLIKTRRSIHVFQDKPIPEELIMKALELAIWAPSAGNQQNWLFYVIYSQEVKNRIAEGMQSVNQIIMSWPEMASVRPPGPPPGSPLPAFGSPPPGPRVPGRPDMIRQSPVLIAVACKKTVNPMDQVIIEKAKTDPKARQIIDGVNIADTPVQSVSGAIAYLQLALHQLGLGSVWMTGPTQAKSEIEQVLQVPPDYHFIAMIPVGYPAESPVKDRKPLSEVVRVLK